MLPTGSVRTFKLGASKASPNLFESWRDAHIATFNVAVQADQIESFHGSLQLWATRRFILSKSSCTTVGLLRPQEPPAGMLLDYLGFRLLVNGNVKGDMGTRKIAADAGDIFCFDLQQAMYLQTSTDGDVTADFTLWVPRARLQSIIADETVLHGFVLKCPTPAGAMLGAALRTLSIHVTDMSANEIDQTAEGLVELAARLLTFSLSSESQAAEPTASFVTIRRFIDGHLLSKELGAEMIAKNFGLSRASLYRLFEPIGGIAHYIRKKRLDRAYEEIAAVGFANRRIGPIAYRCGFKSVAAFNRAFREAYGMNPTQARSAASQLPTRTVVSPAGGSDTGVLAKWLLEMSNH